MKTFYIDEEGRVRTAGIRIARVNIPWELREAVVWLMRAILIAGAAFQLRASLGPY